MDEFSREELEQLYSVFRDQSLQILDDMGEDLLALESRGIEAETLGRLRRGAHTIKGDAACIGLEGVTEIAHRVEDIIGWVVEGKLDFEADVVDRILSNLDSIRRAISGDEIRDISQEEIAALADRFNASYQETGSGQLRKGIEVNKEETEALAAGRLEKRGEEAQAASNIARRDYVRVEASRIDSLLNLAGEMVIARSLLNEIVPELEEALPKNELVARLNGAGVQLGKQISELQKSVLKMRMVAIGTVFKRFARPMRELAAERGKVVELETEGDETELDRTLVDAMYEPLLHLLRNAVDHGIETADERVAKGKPQAGRIKLRAYHEGNQVVVEVSDDGCGIDMEALKAKAMETGVMSVKEIESLVEEQALELIFLQGVSTARELTWVSGRGVGMAAVRAAIEQMRGTIGIRSSKGEGTSFVIRMPLTLAIIRGLLFISSGQLFALPLLSVSEIVRVRADEITVIDDYESLRLRDSFISLIRPGVVLGFERRKGGAGSAIRPDIDRPFVIVLNAGSGKYGVIADSLLGEQELVIKPLEERWVQNDALAGASVLGDGRVSLIMDAGEIIRKGVKYERRRVEARGGYGNRA
ncbi:MAG TPA: chemotaxis protein CheA [Blastocatellia bacterium]|nr:chemotaxis protein CheA [Blastocatellia bacterium]